MMTIKFTPNDKGNPPGKLADAELHFTDHPLRQLVQDTTHETDAAILAASENLLASLKLIGFAIWERRDGTRNGTYPARTYSVNGERRSFGLLRPIATANGQARLTAFILVEYAAFEQARAEEVA